MYIKEKEIIYWAIDKGIIAPHKHNRTAQMFKTHEEVSELLNNNAKNRDIRDDIGDVYVTIVVQSRMGGNKSLQDIHSNPKDLGLSDNITMEDLLVLLVSCVGMATYKINEIEAKLVGHKELHEEVLHEEVLPQDEIFEEANMMLSTIYNLLILICDKKGLLFEECVNLAYDEIKGRTGNMVNGVFVKDG
jgi:hypothetical protein